MRYTTPYYTSNFYTFVEDEGIDVALNSLLQSQTLSLVEVQRVVSLLLGDSLQGQVLSASDVDANLPIVIASLIQNQTLSPSALTFVLGVAIDALRQDQTLAAMLVDRAMDIGLDSLAQAQELEQAHILTAGRCFCISLSAEGKIVVTFGDVTQTGVTFGAGRKPIAVEFQTKTCGA